MYCIWPFFPLLWSCCSCCCGLPIYIICTVAAPLLLCCCYCYIPPIAAAAAVGCLAAPSAAGCVSCSAARAAPSCSTAATAAAESGQDNSLWRLSALSRARTRDHTIGTSPPTTVLARQDLFNQAQQGQRGSILEHSADANMQFG